MEEMDSDLETDISVLLRAFAPQMLDLISWSSGLLIFFRFLVHVTGKLGAW